MLATKARPCTARPALLRASRSTRASSSQLCRQSNGFSSLQISKRSSRPDIAILAAAEQQQATEQQQEDRAPPGCARYSVQLSKPLGLVLEEDGNGNIFVAEVVEGGNASRSGEVSVGDQLIATSGFTYTTQQKYQDNWVRGGEQVVRLNVRGEDFKTIMAAIGSHPAHVKVQLEFQRC